MGLLSTKIKSEMESQFGAPTDPAQMQKFADALEAAIMSYLNSGVTVKPGIAVATTGSPTAQTGATTAPGQLQAS